MSRKLRRRRLEREKEGVEKFFTIELHEFRCCELQQQHKITKD